MARRKPAEAGFASIRGLWVAGPLAIAALALAGGPAASDDADQTSVSPDLPVRVEIEKPAPTLARGRTLFKQRCATCHGRDGRGNGPTARHLNPRPTDLTRGLFKIRSTPQGTTPTDEDLYRTLTFGIPGTSMPGWMGLSSTDRWQLVYYVESLAPDFDKRRGAPIAIPEPPPATAASIERGRAIYHTLQCVQCHGENGRGNGPTSGNLVDDRGHRIYPFNFSRSAKFKGGSGARDIYRTIHTGLDGTPMKSFAGMITERDSWALVHYVRSLRVDAPKPPVVAETEAETYTARLAEAQATAKLAAEQAQAARAEADQLREEVAASKTILDQLMAEKAEADREAAARAAREAAERRRAEREAAERAKRAKARAAARKGIASEARSLYRSRCAVCHGHDGHGKGPAAGGLNPKPRNFADASWQKSISDRRIEQLIVKGGAAMGKSDQMPPNPDLASKPEVVAALRRMVRGFAGK